MTKDEALTLALEALERYQVKRQDFDRFADEITAIKEALAQPTEPRNFCPRCGKRTADLTVIHTCTPPEGGHQ